MFSIPRELLREIVSIPISNGKTQKGKELRLSWVEITKIWNTEHSYCNFQEI